MRSHLRSNRLDPEPRNLADGRRRLALLDREVASIDKQLRDPERRARSSAEGYAVWKRAAEDARRSFQVEAHLTRRWLDEREVRDARQLLREAWQLLTRVELELDLGEEDQALMERLDDFHGVPTESAAENNSTTQQGG